MRSVPLVLAAAALALVAMLALWLTRTPDRAPAPTASIQQAAPAPPETAPGARGAANRTALDEIPDGFGPPRTSLADATAAVGPEAAPVAALLWAVAAGDVATLRALYAPHAARQIDHVGWDRHVAMSDALFLRQLGRYPTGPFDYSFDGDGERGAVTVRRDAAQLGPLPVARSGARWLLTQP